MNKENKPVIMEKTVVKEKKSKVDKRLITESDLQSRINVRTLFKAFLQRHPLKLTDVSKLSGISYTAIGFMKNDKIAVNIVSSKNWTKLETFIIDYETPREDKSGVIEFHKKEKSENIGKDTFVMGRIGSKIFLPYGVVLEIEIGSDCTTITEIRPTKGKRGTMYVYYK